jgi:hypothetical protein
VYCPERRIFALSYEDIALIKCLGVGIIVVVVAIDDGEELVDDTFVDATEGENQQIGISKPLSNLTDRARNSGPEKQSKSSLRFLL